MAAGAEAMGGPQELLLVSRDLRVAVGENRRIVEVKAGDPWPANAAGGRIEVLIRTGYVIRFDEKGELDPLSHQFARRLGISRPPLYPVRTFLQRAQALAQRVKIEGRSVRVYPGRPDGAELALYVIGGRAYPVLRGAPDAFAAREALRLSLGGTTPAPRRRSSTAKGAKRRRRRRPKE